MDTTLDHVFGRYTRHLSTYAKPRSLSFAQWAYRLLDANLGPDCDLAALRLEDVESLVAALEPRSAATINGALRALKAAMRLSGLNVESVRLLRAPKPLPTVLARPHFERLLEHAPDARMLAVLLLAHSAGLRHQEITHLRVADVDFARARVKIRAKDGWSPKNHAAREVAFKPDGRLSTALYAQTGGRPRQEWLFPGRGLRPIADFHHEVRAVYEAAGLYDRAERPGLHQLRRTWASTLASNDVPLPILRDLGGWESIEVVERYVRTMDGAKDRAAVIMD